MEFHQDVYDDGLSTFDIFATADTIREDCVADEKKQKEYLGDSIGLNILTNTEFF